MSKVSQKLILVFGESDNDRRAIIELCSALRSDAGIHFKPMRDPPVLLKKSERPEKRRKTAEAISTLVKINSKKSPVASVVAHRDCDKIEPSHEELSESIERGLYDAGVPNPVAAAPAYEIEAWWLLFPEALAATCANWEKVDMRSRQVGSIENAKEFLCEALRPKDKAKRMKCKEYVESDSIKIAQNIRKLNLTSKLDRGRSRSFDRFVERFNSVCDALE
ncbi:hypothetical protein [Inquilinus sp. Marseille-Q2685]|uniref:hypothetical protein n=1 Tax=Inquilinus sp. Marseille-Q2685 TaxID=2866581 RepID=UPI001CE4122F|nr:hypothetical protein [Inquilinus sp. Marseille-Q2685]